MSKLHIKKDDTVIVIAGADKGKTDVLADQVDIAMVSRELKLQRRDPV